MKGIPAFTRTLYTVLKYRVPSFLTLLCLALFTLNAASYLLGIQARIHAVGNMHTDYFS